MIRFVESGESLIKSWSFVVRQITFSVSSPTSTDSDVSVVGLPETPFKSYGVTSSICRRILSLFFNQSVDKGTNKLKGGGSEDDGRGQTRKGTGGRGERDGEALP